ncbi:hypothetical protein LJR027_002821 [Terrabacter sp. LjRoot27]|jgi:hypothetical protein|uniref:hypothetical protein n=1 Tax=Terrabacter sp. LjRoot27 TaxID=3342306 RepID=UPI003ECFB8B4
MGDPEELRPDPEPSGRGGLSASGWAAVTALGAAAITAAATLVTHFLPPPGSQQDVVAGSEASGSSRAGSLGSASSTARPLTPVPAPVPAPRSELLERLTGTWSGPARSGALDYTLTLVVTSTCAERRPCGTMTTSLLPCVGSITLVKIDDGPAFDFATGSFSPDSSSSCELRTGGGDYFVLGDDVLAYRTGYDSGTQGILHRVS